jgi:DNA-directed RNA polymerase sigma subunit (sigma70/sigma32)
VHSVIVDFMRSADYSNLSAWEDMSEMEAAKDPSPEEKTIEQSERRTLWELLESRLNDRKERLVIECSFVFDLKPQQILDEFRAEFSDIDEIYRVKQNVISRLRRDAEFRQLLGIDD